MIRCSDKPTLVFDNLGSDVAECCCTTSGNFAADKAVQGNLYILLGVGRILILVFGLFLMSHGKNRCCFTIEAIQHYIATRSEID